jgi:hypothetical protein
MTNDQLEAATVKLAELRGESRATDQQLRQEIRELYQALQALDFVFNKELPT